MTAAELIEDLKELPPNTLIAVSSDPEGNDYSLLANEGSLGYLLDNIFATDRDVKDPDYRYIKDDGKRVYVLWPK